MGYEEFVDNFLGSLYRWTIFFLGGEGSFLYILGLSHKVKVQNQNFFISLNFKYFLGMPDINFGKLITVAVYCFYGK